MINNGQYGRHITNMKLLEFSQIQSLLLRYFLTILDLYFKNLKKNKLLKPFEKITFALEAKRYACKEKLEEDKKSGKITKRTFKNKNYLDFIDSSSDKLTEEDVF